MSAAQQIINALKLSHMPFIVTYELPIQYDYAPIVKRVISIDNKNKISKLEKVIPSAIKFFIDSHNALLLLEKNSKEVAKSEHLKIKKVLFSCINDIEYTSSLVTIHSGYFGLTESGFYFFLIFNQEKDKINTLMCEDMIVAKNDVLLLELFCQKMDIENSYQKIKSEIGVKHFDEILTTKIIQNKKIKI